MKLYVINRVRTNNFNDAKIGEKIRGLWQEIAMMPELANETKYGIYSDYESNYEGDYTCSIATEKEVSTAVIFDTDGQHYQKFPVTDNDVTGTWAMIWQLESKGQLNRTYTFDFERYTVDGQIEIWIAVNVK
ncbi:effector binding domain-containing protein [Isobaculum melis]|uniref:Predicted transcriptional regulator YdeE, contains AraC-type DNA-binding domain n=1 Tax=Isobaculum melis TaxID=142588 RepID=A0A1H9STB2_9LACT|nr:effector binding domain-containing protein [Isobaculum melis]SER88252.1 Predicted transcriptional regulator YdeE, contains AraC-type DNA-binding domain [Isobaculum melis]